MFRRGGGYCSSGWVLHAQDDRFIFMEDSALPDHLVDDKLIP